MNNLNIEPDIKISVNQTFGIESDMEVEAFSKKNEYVPEIDTSYKFDKESSVRFNKNKKLCEKDKDAFRIMELDFSADWTNIQKKFKTLVKKFHPDKHSGSKQYEDKLKKITLAYSHLKMIMTTK